MRPTPTTRQTRSLGALRPLRSRALATAVAATLGVGALAACSTDTAAADNSDTAQAASDTATTDADAADTDSDAAAPVDAVAGEDVEAALAANLAYETGETDVDVSSAVAISLSGDTATASGDGASAVTVDGSTVTITASGTYVVSGTLTDGQIVVDSADDGVVTLVLDGADITSTTTGPLQVADAGSVVVVLADGSTNTLNDARTAIPEEDASGTDVCRRRRYEIH